jgi:hypothetical protein
LRFLIKNLSSIDTIKLTVAPIAAKTTVLKTSSEYKFGTILKKIPPAVFILVEISICIDNYTLLPAPLIPVEGLRASSLLVVIWLTAESTPPTTAKYPPSELTTIGKAIGAAKIVPPTAANTNPIFRSTLKYFGVGAFALFIIFIIYILRLNN